MEFIDLCKFVQLEAWRTSLKKSRNQGETSVGSQMHGLELGGSSGSGGGLWSRARSAPHWR